MTERWANLARAKRTSLGLYITAQEAYEAWKAAPERISIIDVRTPDEWLFVGHPPMAWKVPVAVQSYEWDPQKRQFPMRPLPDFVDRVRRFAAAGDELMVMCRSGGRSAMAVNLLAQAGFTNVFQVVDGMEGDVVDDPDSVYRGWRMKNGWKNARCPWTCELTPERMLLPRGAHDADS